MALTNMNPSSLMMRNEINRNYSLVNAADYQSAQALIIRAQEIFESKLRALAPSNVTGSIGQLEIILCVSVRQLEAGRHLWM